MIKNNRANPVRGSYIGSGAVSELTRTKIVNALSNTEYRARTISGVARESSLTSSQVIKAIKDDKTLGGIVKVYPIRSKEGRVLLTTKDRFAAEATIKERFVDFFASKRVGLEDAE